MPRGYDGPSSSFSINCDDRRVPENGLRLNGKAKVDILPKASYHDIQD